MSIAGAWRSERCEGGDVSVKPTLPANRLVREDTGFVVGDQITRRVLALRGGEDDVGRAMKALAWGVRRRVTFRRAVVVSCAPPKDFDKPMDELPHVGVPVGLRGTAMVVMVDGRSIVELDDGRTVLARVGEDCRLLGRWYKLVDWLRRHHEKVIGIDHHAHGDDVAPERVVDKSAASTTQILLPLLEVARMLPGQVSEVRGEQFLHAGIRR